MRFPAAFALLFALAASAEDRPYAGKYAAEPECRRIIQDPALIPNAVEEIMRAYPIVGMGRKLTEDIDFHGCPMKKDQMLYLNLPSATRDPRDFPDADKVIIDRTPNRHVAFGASEHRCVGSHLREGCGAYPAALACA